MKDLFQDEPKGELSEKEIQNRKINEIIENLGASDDNLVMDALGKAKVDGDARLIPALVDVLVDRDTTPEVEAEVMKIFNQLKFKQCIPPMIEAIKDDRTAGYRHQLVGSFWQSGFSLHSYLPDLISLAISEDFETTFEILTVIENFTRKPQEQHLVDAMEMLQYAIPAARDNQQLLTQIMELLKDQYASE